MKETVFEILAEGGGITIERLRDRNGDKFFYNHSEFDMSGEGLDVNHNGEFTDFEEPFHLLNSKFQWYELHLETVHFDFRDFVATELVKTLNFRLVMPDELVYSKEQLEKVLNIRLEYQNRPLKNGLQKIKVTNLMKLTEYEYQEYTAESGKPNRLKGKYEIWTDEQIYSRDYNEIIREKYEFETTGKLEVSGNTIVIRGESGQIEFAFSSDKFFVTANPILSRSKEWYCREF